MPGARKRLIKNGHRTEAFTYQECLRHVDEAGVDRVMIVPGSWEGDRIDYALEVCEKHPDRFGVMARIPQINPEEAKAMLGDWQSIPYPRAPGRADIATAHGAGPWPTAVGNALCRAG